MICGRPECNAKCIYYLRLIKRCAHPKNKFIGPTWHGPLRWWEK